MLLVDGQHPFEPVCGRRLRVTGQLLGQSAALEMMTEPVHHRVVAAG